MDLSFLNILGAAFPVFLLLGLGFGLRKTLVLTQEADVSLLRLVVRVFYPCLFLDFIIGNPALKGAGNLVSAPLVGFITTAGGFAVAFWVARLIRLQKGTGLRSFSFCNGVYNYGYIPIPVIMALFGDRETLGVLLVHNLGVEVAIWTTGIILLSGGLSVAALRKLVNPPLIALAAALSINALGIDGHIPDWISKTISMLGACSIPIGILLAGAGIADLMTRRGLFDMPKVAIGSIGVRLLLLPVGFLALAAFLPGISEELRRVIVIQAAMPAGIFPIVIARHYGGDAPVAVRVVLATTIASVITMPLWIRFGSALVLQ